MLTFEERRAIKHLVSEARKEKAIRADRECANCGETFTPSTRNHSTQIYCTMTCRDNVRLAVLNIKNQREREQRETAAA